METGFNFEYCDGLANVCKRAVDATSDLEVLRHSVRVLPILGQHHNRWHVRDVLTSILQSITTADRALVALEALQAAGVEPVPVEWSFEEFVIRTLHPVLRVGIPKVSERY